MKINHRKFKHERKIKISLEGYGELVFVLKGRSATNLEEFSCALRAEVDNKWYTVRRHCWTKHQDRFHTHVRTGIGKKRYKTIFPPPMKGSIQKALNWAKNDMINNWYIYLKYFNKIVKKNKRVK